MSDTQKIDDNLLWYKDAIIYELHIKAFKDSNGDGIGDFKGLLEKLDYLEDLGVTAIWLLPFYPSPLRDDGYDIADYYSINPNYGTINDFKRFLKEAHARNLKVITELVINHTSEQHPWFQRARRAPKGSPERDYYVWSDDPNKYSDTRIIFTDYEPSNWTWDPVAEQYYWHRFFHHQPDLNFDNPVVQDEIFKVLDYWLDMGVDGFRLDAIPYLFEREGTNCENLPETHAFLKKLRKHVDDNHKGKLLLAEANMWPEDSAAYFGDGDECHMNYHFPIMPRMFMSVKMEDRYPIIDILEQTPEIPANCQWGMFLRNHDELTLEMVTDEERDYMYRVYAKDPQAKINLGIRHRLAPLLENDRRKIELMNVLLFSMPGTPVLYYGDEIGMGDNYYLGDRDGVRTPFQWNADRNAGFSSANPQKLFLPVILDPEYQYESVNVEIQQRNSNSLLWWMKRVIAMRNHYKVFGRGTIKFFSPRNPKILAFIREYENEVMLVIANLSRYSQAAEIDLSDYAGYTPVEVFSHNKFPDIGEDSAVFTLGSHGYYWFLLEKEEEREGLDTRMQKPAFAIAEWNELQDMKVRGQMISKLLRPSILHARWFGGKARTVVSIDVLEQIAFQHQEQPFYWLLLEVNYNEGLPEMYQIPITYCSSAEAEDTRGDIRKGFLGRITLGGDDVVLYDAVYNPAFRHYLMASMLGKVSGQEKLEASSVKDVADYYKEEEITSKVLNAEQSNTSIIFNGKFFLKLYRKLDTAMNSDLEITRFLTEVAKFENVPRYQGSLTMDRDGSKKTMVLGMLQEAVENQGDAWVYMLDVLRQYFERVQAKGEAIKKLPALKGSLLKPVAFENVPEILQNIIGGAYLERVDLLGRRTAQMHKMLASHPEVKDFGREEFSLHYQRSLYSSLQSLTRNSFDLLKSNLKNLPEEAQEEAASVLGMREEVLSRLKKIYSHKIDALKIRAHGDYHLGQVLFTGKDFIIIDFEGEPARSFSERRLRRSPLRDVAGMLRSFHYAAYGSLYQFDTLRPEEEQLLENWAEQWYHYNAGFYLKAYLEELKGTGLIPEDENDRELMLNTFLLEKAIYELGYELNNRPDWVIIPLRGIKYIMEKTDK
jgi:maltose alpha-D-glucosyltransferase/alpha-amylase